jgi:hypothetical protein
MEGGREGEKERRKEKRKEMKNQEITKTKQKNSFIFFLFKKAPEIHVCSWGKGWSGASVNAPCGCCR